MSTAPFHIEDRFIGRTPGDHDPARARVFVDADWDGTRLSLTGTVIEHGMSSPASVGQVTDDVRAVSPRLADLWDRWHLNDMRAGCAHQEAAYRAGEAVRPTWKNKYAGMDTPCPECAYRYGSMWLAEDVPDTALAEIRSLLTD